MRIELLNKLGFAWNAQETASERHITDLMDFKQEYSDCLLPLLYHSKYPQRYTIQSIRSLDLSRSNQYLGSSFFFTSKKQSNSASRGPRRFY